MTIVNSGLKGLKHVSVNKYGALNLHYLLLGSTNVATNTTLINDVDPVNFACLNFRELLICDFSQSLEFANLHFPLVALL